MLDNHASAFLLTTILLGAFAATNAPSQGQRSQRAKLPTLTSDLPDYGPGETAILTGSGFLPNESVVVQVVHADGTPSTGSDHDPWNVSASRSGTFVTSWHVCEDDCVGATLKARAVGATSGLRASTLFTDSHACGTGVVTAVTPVGGSCSVFTPAVGNGPDNYEVGEGGTYTMTITGVTECSGDTITVFVQNGDTGNFCFDAVGGAGTYVGTFTMPDPACNTSPISYKCGSGAACNHPNSFAASGPTSGCGGVHLRASTFDGNCNKTGDDAECFPPPCITFTLDFQTDDTGNPLLDKQIIDDELDGDPLFPLTCASSSNINACGSVAGTAAIYDSNAAPHGADPDLAVNSGNILILQTDLNLATCGSGFFCSGNDDEDGGTLSFDFNGPVTPLSIALVDIDDSGPDEVVTITLFDGGGDTEVYTVPMDWTGDIAAATGPGIATLLFNGLAQAGPGPGNPVATVVTGGSYDATDVVSILIEMGGQCPGSNGGSGGIDNLSWCE